MVHMKLFASLRGRIVVWLLMFAYLCYVAFKAKYPNGIVLAVGAGILLAIFMWPSPKDDAEPKQKKRPHGPR